MHRWKILETKNPQTISGCGLNVHQRRVMDVFLVPKAGLEPARVAPLPPQDSVSTNSTTSATFVILR